MVSSSHIAQLVDDLGNTPAGNVKYNTIVVSGNIEFTEAEKEIQYIAFTGVRTQVVNQGSNILLSLIGLLSRATKVTQASSLRRTT